MKCEENWCEEWKKIVQITSNKIFETKNRTQAKFKKKKKICICLIFDYYCQSFISDSIQFWGFPDIFLFSKILRFKSISKSYTTFFILDIKFVLRCSKALQYYDEDCLKTFLLLSTSLTMIQVFENIPILAQKITFSWKTRQIWKLLNVTFWPKPNMRNSAYTNKTLNLEILLNLIALHMYWRFQKALNL